MERLTDSAQGYCEVYCKKYGRCFDDPGDCTFEKEKEMYEKLKQIEGIVTFDRLLELAFSDRDGRCVVLPAGGYTDKDGENALKSAMNTCFCHNNPVTRYIADAVAEKLTREAAERAMKGKKDG